MLIISFPQWLSIDKYRSQTVYNHLKTHINNPTEDNCIEWEILHSGINNMSIRRIVEAIEISKIGPAVMNGCIGRTLDI